jgi:hypothetical protein
MRRASVYVTFGGSCDGHLSVDSYRNDKNVRNDKAGTIGSMDATIEQKNLIYHQASNIKHPTSNITFSPTSQYAPSGRQ